MGKKIKIAIAEDHPYFSKGVVSTLQLSKKYIISVVIENASNLFDSIKLHNPEILILDINLSEVNTLKFLPEIKKQNQNIKILILSMYLPNQVEYDSFSKYIDSYVLKNSGAEILTTALDHIMNGEKYLDPNTNTSIDIKKDKFSNKIKLSSREVEILELLKIGLSNKIISQKLFISELTVKTHRKNIMFKIGVNNIVELIRNS